jgi:hypothetical protein
MANRLGLYWAHEDRWVLRTPPGASEFTMHTGEAFDPSRAEAAEPRATLSAAGTA